MFVKDGWFPLVVRDRDRARYIAALEQADCGNLKTLVDYFARLQKDEFVRALSIAEDVIKARRVEDAIKSVRQQLRARRDALVAEWNTAQSIAETLRDVAQQRLTNIAAELANATRDLVEHGEYFADGAPERGERSHFYRYQIIQTAKKLDYFANTHTYRSWARLVLRNANQTELLIAFHGIGHEFQGVLACSASWFQRVETAERDREIGPVTSRYGRPISDQL